MSQHRPKAPKPIRYNPSSRNVRAMHQLALEEMRKAITFTDDPLRSTSIFHWTWSDSEQALIGE